VLPASDAMKHALTAVADSPDAVVRAAALDVLRQLRAGDTGTFAAALTDPDRRVRLEAVRGLVSLAEAGRVAGAAGDASREVRVAVAEGLGTIGGGPATAALRQLAADGDPLVRAAAFTAAGAAGCPAPLDALAAEALHDPAWQVRVGAAQALAAAGPQLALASLGGAAADPHADVRKAVVIGLAGQAGLPAARDILHAALGDTDADVRAHARHALASDQPSATPA
jgi:HEAT repeat protein